MKVKSTLVRPFAELICKSVQKHSMTAIADQNKILSILIRKGSKTKFGKDHGFTTIHTTKEFAELIPIRDYEQLRSYIDLVVNGEKDVLWPGRPRYFAKTSGTTSGAKYIPITRDSMPNHFNSARNALFCQAHRLRDYSFFDGKMIFLSGSPEMGDTNGIPTGRLSGIVNHAVPAWLRRNQLPSYATNCIEDWDEKIESIIEETKDQPMTLISGIPPWVKDYFERLLQRSGRETIGELFPDLQFMVHGGVNFEPYRSSFDHLIGRPYRNVETYPASEGFIAFQDAEEGQGLLLNTNSGIFFEFVPATEFGKDSAPVYTLEDVEVGVNYALVLSSNAGLWRYNIGDTIEFVSLDPYRIRVTGRIAHFISAFGEHVIASEIEQAMKLVSDQFHLDVSAFTVAPMIAGEQTAESKHQWIIESEKDDLDIQKISEVLDQSVRESNSYYDDLRRGQMLTIPDVILVKPGSFSAYMRSIGKQGGQNKVAIVSNDRKIADALLGQA